MAADPPLHRYTIAECSECDNHGRVRGEPCGVCLGDRYLFVDGHPCDATHYIDHSALHHSCDRCTPQQEAA